MSAPHIDIKALGNKAFALKNYDDAINLYTKALNSDEKNAVLFSNRALCQLKLNNWDKGLQDCDSGLKYVGDDEKTMIKLLFRKASAFKGMGSFKLAHQYFQQVINLDPSNQAAISELKSLPTIETSSPKNSSSKVQIPIEKVDQLPAEFQNLMSSHAKTTVDPLIPIKTVENDELVNKEINELLSSRPSNNSNPQETPFNERSATSSLMALKSIPGADKNQAYKFVMRLPITTLMDDFSYGIEPEFLAFYIEAAASVSTEGLIQSWETTILNNLKKLSSLKRFELSKVFINKDDIDILLKNVENKDRSLVGDYKRLLE